MKKLISSFLLLLAISLVSISCNRDDENISSGFFQIDSGEKITIDNTNVHEELNYNSTNNHHYTFIFTHLGNTTVNGITATETVQLEVEFPKTENLNGNFNYYSNTRKILFGGTWYMNFNGSNGALEQISEGTCTIKRNNMKNFTINFSFKSLTGKIINGEYSGNVILHDANN